MIPKVESDNDGNLGEPASKRRRVGDGTPNSITRKKPESPPWKRVIAEGPSSFTQDGVRKSGRTNAIPLDLQPPSDKRQTRRANRQELDARKKVTALDSKPTSLHTASHDPKNASTKLSKRPASSGKVEVQESPKARGRPGRPRKSLGVEDSSPTRDRSCKYSNASKDQQNASSPKRERRPRRSSGVLEDMSLRTPEKIRTTEDTRTPHSGSAGKVSRIRFRVNPPTIPKVHPDTILKKAPLYPTFEEFMERAVEVPVERGGLFSSDEEVKYTEDMARRDAQFLLKIEEATQDGGILSPGVASVYRPEDSDHDRRNALKQYAHRDHLVKAATGFRALMLEEHRNHRRVAKRLAEACRDEWVRRQPKSQEEIEADALRVVEGRYKAVMKSLQVMWDNVKNEINRRRLAQWEAEEQARVRKALNQAVDLSQRKLEARRARTDSEMLSDRLDTDASSDEDVSMDSDEAEDSNMSSSASDPEDDAHSEVAEDENMTVEELRKKYADLPETPHGDERSDDESEADKPMLAEGMDPYAGEWEEDLESDESVDMDDDMGSSDKEGSDSSDEDESERDDQSEDEGMAPGLLGFLAPSELRSLRTDDKDAPDATTAEEDDVDEVDEVSLIPDPSQVNGISTPSLIEELLDTVGAVDTDMKDLQATEDDALVDIASRDRSSQPTPETGDTKPSEPESASSIDLHHSSRQHTHSATPQPSSYLKTPVPFLLRGTLREYQHYGLDWLAGLYANNTNGILADEMGLGKTIQTIALLAHLACEHHVWGPHLVIVPTSVMLNWEMEFKKWCPGFKILTYYGSPQERQKKRVGWLNDDLFNVCITSYQIVLQDAVVFRRRKWHYMILDEAHNIKNFRSQRWQTLLTFNSRARLLLTGTPLQNNLTELWSLLFFLMPSDGDDDGPGGFADLKEFSDWFKKPQDQILENGRETMDDEARAIISKLHKVLRPYLLRRMKADVEKQMPGKYEHVEYCRLSRRQRELYDGFLSRSDTRGTLASGNYLSIMNCLMQLRKVCNHPDLFQERPILSSYPMKKSVVAGFEIKELLVRRKLLKEELMSTVSLEFLNMVPVKHERFSSTTSARSAMLTAQRVFMELREAQRVRAQYAHATMDPSTVKSNLAYLESATRWSRFEELQHCVYLNALRRQQTPIYGNQLIQRLSFGLQDWPLKKRPERIGRTLEWLGSSSEVLQSMILTREQRSATMHTAVEKFACITPPIIAPDILPTLLTRRGIELFQSSPDRLRPDPFHEARMRLSIQFPDKRLLQYDCGKLQVLDKLLRRLQSGGHRALIFTQMTKVLDILEQFLNIHGYRYLRLDGATKIEQRQIMTERFNNDTRITVFILSSRSGGLGINLTGADTVIFYDLDWNPALDKQCQDRAHRIGQTRDVHIYRLVSEHTIEVNILRKANQKRMLDDVVIQEGEFTTDHFNKISVDGVPDDDVGLGLSDGDAAANAAMDRLLGNTSTGDVRVLEQVEDQEDVAAAKIAQQEIQLDDQDFEEKVATGAATPRTPGTETPAEELPSSGFGTTPALEGSAVPEDHAGSAAFDPDEVNAWGAPIVSIDDYMLKIMSVELKDAPLPLPKDKSKSKKGKDHRHRSHRAR